MTKLVIIAAAAATLGTAVPASAQAYYPEDSNRSRFAGPEYGYWGHWGHSRGGPYVYSDVPRYRYGRSYRRWGPYGASPYAAYGYRPYGAYGYRTWRWD